MKLSVSVAFLIGMLLALPALPAPSANAQTIVPQQQQLPAPFANWQTDLESQFTQTLIDASRGNKAVSIEVTRLEVDLNSEVPLKSFFKPGSFEVHTGSLPTVDWKDELGDSRLSSAERSSNSTTKSVAACDTVRVSMPVMLGKLDETGVAALKRSLAGQSNIQSPIATCYSGFPVTINDVAERPFVVGVKPLVNGKNIAHQPIIQTIEDGTLIRFKPTVKDGNIDLEGTIAQSTISKVQTFQISGTVGEGVMVQVPEHTVKRIRLATTLQDGETLFVDPRLKMKTQQTEKKTLLGKAKVTTVEKQIYFLVTTRVVAQPEEVTTSLTQAK